MGSTAYTQAHTLGQIGLYLICRFGPYHFDADAGFPKGGLLFWIRNSIYSLVDYYIYVWGLSISSAVFSWSGCKRVLMRVVGWHALLTHSDSKGVVSGYLQHLLNYKICSTTSTALPCSVADLFTISVGLVPGKDGHVSTNTWRRRARRSAAQDRNAGGRSPSVAGQPLPGRKSSERRP